MGKFTVKTPVNFTLDRKYTRDFVNVLDKIYHTSSSEVYLDFSSTKNVSKGDFMVLMAQIEKISSTKPVKFYYGKQNSKIVEQFFSIDVLRLKKDASSIPIEIIKDFANKLNILDPLVVANVTNDLQKIGINKNNKEYAPYCERVEALLTEITGNAIEHGIRNLEINCWLTTEVNQKQKEVRFTFVDMGTGIVTSHKEAKLPLLYRIFPDSKIVLDSLYGKLPSSNW